jgi:hypothetical protein
MTEKGDYPLVYQLVDKNGVMVPVGLAESSAISVYSISATQYYGFELTGAYNFTGILATTSTGGGTDLIVTGGPPSVLNIRTLSTSLGGFIDPPSVAVGGELTFGWGSNPLPVVRGGTNSADTPLANGIAHWKDGKLTTDTGFIYLGGDLSIPTGGEFQINGTKFQITDLKDIPTPTDDNTFLQHNGGTYSWASATGGAGGSPFPNIPGRIPVTNSTTLLDTYDELAFNTATKVLTTYSINNVCDVCAVRINEGGTLLSNKYQGKDTFLTTLATQATVNLNSSQVCGTLPITSGGTGSTTPGGVRSNLNLVPGTDIQAYDVVLNSIAGLNPVANELIYFNAPDTATTTTITPNARNLLDDTTFAAMRDTLQLSALATKSQVSLTSDVTNTLPITNGGTGKTSFVANQLIFGNALEQDASLTYTKATTTFSSTNVCAAIVCATTFNEGGQTLASKYQPVGSYLTSIPSEYLTQTEGDGLYQPCDVFLTTLATQDTVNLATGQVCGTLPINRGGTNKTSFTANQLVYGQFDQNSNLTFDGTTFKSPTVCATTVCGTNLFENGVNITSKYETQTNAANTYTTKSTYNTFTGTLALSAGLKDVSIASPSIGQVLKWTGSNWANQADATGTGGTTLPTGPYAWDGIYVYQDAIMGPEVVQPATSINSYYLQSSNGVVKWSLENVDLIAPNEFSRNACATPFNGMVVDELSATNFYNTSSEINDARITTLSATTYLNLPNVSALAGTGVFEVTSYSRTNYVLTSTNLSLSNTVTGHLASAVHWDLATLNNNYINASGDSVTGSFYFGNLSAAVFSATTISATNAYIASTVQFNTGITPTLAVGQMSWNSTDQTLDIQTTLDTTLQIGQEQVMLVENKSGATILNGKVVYVSGTTGGSGKLNVALAAASSVNSETAFIIGVATQNINDNSTGFVTTFGKVNGIPLPTAQFADGDIAYLGDTPGELRNYKPSKPSHGSFQMGRVIRAHNTNGILFVTIRGSVDMSEIHDVASSTPSNGQVLVWNTASGVYEPKNVSAISGINNYATTASLVLSGLSDTLITSPSLSSVLKWNGTKWVPATDQTGGGGGSPGGTQYHIQVNDGAGGFYGDASLQYDYDTPQITINTPLVVDAVATFNGGTDFTQAGTFTTLRGTSVSSTTVSATNYLNLPSGVATWNANKLQGVSISTTTPNTDDVLAYNGTTWTPTKNTGVSYVLGNNLIL